MNPQELRRLAEEVLPEARAALDKSNYPRYAMCHDGLTELQVGLHVLLDMVEQVLTIHNMTPGRTYPNGEVSPDYCLACSRVWPCPTVRALSERGET